MLRSRRLFFHLLISVFLLLTLVSFYSIWETLFFKDNHWPNVQILQDTEGGRWRKLSSYKRETFSTLGRILFLGDIVPKISPIQEKTIFIWYYGPHLERRFIYRFSKKYHDPFSECSVRCRLSYDQKDLPSADAVVVPIHLGPWDDELEIKAHSSQRPAHQRWIFWSDESPLNIRHLLPNPRSRLNSIFNWTMTYRMDSDIPVPYGRTIYNMDKASEFELASGPPSRSRGRKKHLVAALISNCHSKTRIAYINELSKHITVHFYGNCGDRNCTNHFDTDCRLLKDYYFILAFENSFCSEYITEKTWWNAFYHGSIPIILGPSWHQCTLHLPPGSFLHIDSYPTPAALARHLVRLASQPAALAAFQAWRRRYLVLQEHGYFGSAAFHYCRVCQALYYNSPEKKIYEDFELFWSESDCHIEVMSFNSSIKTSILN